MQFVDDFVLDPQSDYRPAYRIGPFGNADLVANTRMSEDQSQFDNYFSDRFPDRELLVTQNGKSALRKALAEIGLLPDDQVLILTTSGNRYISKCVTSVIEEFCGWSHKRGDRTRALLINHEFGFPYQNLRELQSYGLPIIEDCCHCFASENEEQSVASVGDHVIYSFPKFFPIQFGGMLASKKPLSCDNAMGDRERLYVKKVVGHYIPDIDKFSKRRRSHWQRLQERLEDLGITPRFDLFESVVNGVFMFKFPCELNLDKFRAGMFFNGIESSVFYGENAYFVPSHHNLGVSDLDFFAHAIRHCMQDALLCT